jgi:hypothetical protein
MEKYFEITRKISFIVDEGRSTVRYGWVPKIRHYTFSEGDIVSHGTACYIARNCGYFNLNTEELHLSEFSKPTEVAHRWGVFTPQNHRKQYFADFVPERLPKMEEYPGNFRFWVTAEVAELINSGNYPNWFIRKNHKLSVQEWMEKWGIQLELEKEEEKIHQKAKEAFFARARSNKK